MIFCPLRALDSINYLRGRSQKMSAYEENILIGLGVFLLFSALFLGFIKALGKSKEELPLEISSQINNKHATRNQKILAYSFYYSISFISLLICGLVIPVFFMYLDGLIRSPMIGFAIIFGILFVLYKLGFFKGISRVGNFLLIKVLDFFK
jgi:hypothetical protein